MTVFITVLLLMTATGVHSSYPFSRYEIILQRKPFGEPPAVVESSVPSKPPGPAAPPFTQDLRLVALSDTDFGMRIGIVDVKSQENHYLSLGDSFGEIELVDVVFDKEGVLLRKGEEERWLYMDGRSADVSESASVSSSDTSSRPARRPSIIPPPPGSYRAEMQRRAAQANRQRKEQEYNPPELSGEALQKHLREYNLELIRKAARGEAAGPPLPMELTPEEDAMLVQEGVLPP